MRNKKEPPFRTALFIIRSSTALCSAHGTEAVVLAELFSAESTEKRCGVFRILGNYLSSRISGIFFVVTQMALAVGTIHIAVRIPGTKIQGVVRIPNLRLAGLANLAIGQAAVPLGSLISHTVFSFRFPVKVCSLYNSIPQGETSCKFSLTGNG